MPRIFISYRRADSQDKTEHLYQNLSEAFGGENVFLDVHIPGGHDFREVLAAEIGKSDVVLVMIGANWLTIADEEGRRRLDDPDDFVRYEVETALSRPETIVIPVLINDTLMPEVADLPDALRNLAYRQARPLGSGLDLRHHMQALIDEIYRVTDTPKPATRKMAPIQETPNRVEVGVSGNAGRFSCGINIAVALASFVLLFFGFSAVFLQPSSDGTADTQPTQLAVAQLSTREAATREVATTEALIQQATDLALQSTETAAESAPSQTEEPATQLMPTRIGLTEPYNSTQAPPSAAPTQTRERTPTATDELPTLTPVGEIVEVEGESAPPGQNNVTSILLAFFAALAGSSLILLLFWWRRR